jgi:hypothetical protein
MLIPEWGTQGAAYATLVGFMFHWALTLVLAQRTFFVKLEFRRIAIVLGVAIGVALVSRMIPTQTILKTLLLVFVLVGFWVTDVVLPDEKQTVIHLLGQARRYFGLPTH